MFENVETQPGSIFGSVQGQYLLVLAFIRTAEQNRQNAKSPIYRGDPPSWTAKTPQPPDNFGLDREKTLSLTTPHPSW